MDLLYRDEYSEAQASNFALAMGGEMLLSVYLSRFSTAEFVPTTSLLRRLNMDVVG